MIGSLWGLCLWNIVTTKIHPPKNVNRQHSWLEVSSDTILTSVRDRIGIYFQISIYSKKSLLSLTLENHKNPIGSHCKNFNSLILSYHTWNISKRRPSQIYKQWKSDLDTSWRLFRDRRLFWNKYWFENKSQFDPLPCYKPDTISNDVKQCEGSVYDLLPKQWFIAPKNNDFSM